MKIDTPLYFSLWASQHSSSKHVVDSQHKLTNNPLYLTPTISPAQSSLTDRSLPELQPHPTIPTRVTFSLLVSKIYNPELVLRTHWDGWNCSSKSNFHFKEVFVPMSRDLTWTTQPSMHQRTRNRVTTNISKPKICFSRSQYNPLSFSNSWCPRLIPSSFSFHPWTSFRLPAHIKIIARPTASLQDPARTVN